MATVQEYVVRPLRARDLAAALALWEGVPGVYISVGDDLETLRQFLRRNPGASQGAWVGGVMVGAVLAGHDGRRGYLYHLTVSPEWRRRGIGSALARAAVNRLRELGVPRMQLLVMEDNEAGHRFWEQEGWQRIEAQAFGLL